MNDVIRFVCPACEKPMQERREELITIVSQWVGSDALSTMVEVFGGKIPEGNLKDRINWLNDFAKIWDYRKKLTNENERWNVKEDPVASAKAEIIMNCVRKLGLVDIDEPLLAPDYIIPLGGARMSNYARPLKAREIIDKLELQGVSVIALSGTRPINEVERPFLAEYAPNAVTEYDAISSGMERVFSLRSDQYNEEEHRDSNINLSWAKRTYVDRYRDNTIISLAAPSSDPGRRANSRDTFEFYLDRFKIHQGAKLLLVTSCIYVPFQLLRFMDLAIEKGFYVDCVGINNNKKGFAFSNIANYCQETKASINAIKALSDQWL